MSDESETKRERRGVVVRGVVQGVGFRPFVYRLALEEKLAGVVSNDTDGVTIEIEGSRASIDLFLARLESEPPPLARVDAIVVRDLAVVGDGEFRIESSEVLGRVSTGIPADAATCADCLHELFDPADRRYRYPFLNCTNCGPRFTITRSIPYDRPQTSMARFTMCEACQAEYDDPTNRRFHAQPNGCWECGPQISFVTAEGTDIHAEDPVATAIAHIAAGEILAVKGIGGFHLCVDATNESAVMRLRERKHRYGKPLAVMVRDVDVARTLCDLDDAEAALLTTVARPIVLAHRRPGNTIAAAVAPGIPWLGLFLPYAPLHHILLAHDLLHALVMTSANLSEEPICIDNDEARARLGGIADAFLMHDREILQRCDDSVVAVVNDAPQLIRRARGFVPLGVPLPLEAPPLLAVGGHLKNVFALASGGFVYQSQHLGDLENLTGLDFFRESLEHFMRTFEVEPAAVVHDLHPGYLSTEWAKDWAAKRGVPTIAVQHHHAHVAGCMAEHGLLTPSIGISLDGTGYGTDGRIWGGEVLIVRIDGENPGGFERFAHLDYVPMPGGDAAVREPWRMALSHLEHAGFDVQSPEILNLLDRNASDARVISRMMERDVNAPLTSSCGRLFDAVAAVVLGRGEVDYDAQAAIELEGVAVNEPDDGAMPATDTRPSYELEFVAGNWAERESSVLSVRSMWKDILRDLSAGEPRPFIAAQFHTAVAKGFVRAAVEARAATGIGRVALSGGCMHNRRLARLLRAGLESVGFQVLEHRNVSPGDGGLSYGQAALAAAMLGEKN